MTASSPRWHTCPRCQVQFVSRGAGATRPPVCPRCKQPLGAAPPPLPPPPARPALAPGILAALIGGGLALVLVAGIVVALALRGSPTQPQPGTAPAPAPVAAAGPTAPAPREESPPPPATVPVAEKPAPRAIVNSVGMTLVPIPAGDFLMGSPEEEPGRTPIEKRRRVRISQGFYLGAHEVTQGAYRQVMGANPSQHAERPELPVDSIVWAEAVEFCRRLSLLPAERAAGRTYRLPTAAEWEYACRAGVDAAFHTGPALGPGQANTAAGGRPGPTPVGTFPPNAWGLCDLHGNLWEWCADYVRDYPEGDALTDPVGGTTGLLRTIRGGCWQSPVAECRAAALFENQATSRLPIHGFRVVCNGKHLPEAVAAAPAETPRPAPPPGPAKPPPATAPETPARPAPAPATPAGTQLAGLWFGTVRTVSPTRIEADYYEECRFTPGGRPVYGWALVEQELTAVGQQFEYVHYDRDFNPWTHAVTVDALEVKPDRVSYTLTRTNRRGKGPDGNTARLERTFQREGAGISLKMVLNLRDAGQAGEGKTAEYQATLAPAVPLAGAWAGTLAGTRFDARGQAVAGPPVNTAFTLYFAADGKPELRFKDNYGQTPRRVRLGQVGARAAYTASKTVSWTYALSALEEVPDRLQFAYDVDRLFVESYGLAGGNSSRTHLRAIYDVTLTADGLRARLVEQSQTETGGMVKGGPAVGDLILAGRNGARTEYTGTLARPKP